MYAKAKSSSDMSHKDTFKIPKGLRQLTEELSTQVLRDQPPCIHKHLADYLRAKLQKMGLLNQNCSNGFQSGDATELGKQSIALNRDNPQGINNQVGDVLAEAIHLVDALEELQDSSQDHQAQGRYMKNMINVNMENNQNPTLQAKRIPSCCKDDIRPSRVEFQPSQQCGCGLRREYASPLIRNMKESQVNLGFDFQKCTNDPECCNPNLTQQQLISCELKALSNHVDNLKSALYYMMGSRGAMGQSFGVETSPNCQCSTNQWTPQNSQSNTKARPKIPERSGKSLATVQQCTETDEQCIKEMEDLAAQKNAGFGMMDQVIQESIHYEKRVESKINTRNSNIRETNGQSMRGRSLPVAPQRQFSRVCIPPGLTAETFQPPAGYVGPLLPCSEMKSEYENQVEAEANFHNPENGEMHGRSMKGRSLPVAPQDLAGDGNAEFGMVQVIEESLHYENRIESRINTRNPEIRETNGQSMRGRSLPVAPQRQFSRVCIPPGQTAETFQPPAGYTGPLVLCSELDSELGNESMLSKIQGAVADWSTSMGFIPWYNWFCKQFRNLKELYKRERSNPQLPYKKGFLGLIALLLLLIAFKLLRKLFSTSNTKPMLLDSELPIGVGIVGDTNNKKCLASPAQTQGRPNMI